MQVVQISYDLVVVPGTYRSTSKTATTRWLLHEAQFGSRQELGVFPSDRHSSHVTEEVGGVWIQV